MLYESFLKLSEELREGIQKAYREHNKRKNMRKKKTGREKIAKEAKNCFHGVMGERNYKSPPVPNGPINSTIWLGCAICYFTGGSSVYDLTWSTFVRDFPYRLLPFSLVVCGGS
jgi:hypothetical protein